MILIQAIQHEKLNNPNNPCETANGYVYQDCIYKRIISKVGCQPYWLDYIETGTNYCSEVRKLEEFLENIALLRASNERDLLREYDCLKPCKYMEYKVILILMYPTLNIFCGPDKRRTFSMDL